MNLRLGDKKILRSDNTTVNVFGLVYDTLSCKIGAISDDITITTLYNYKYKQCPTVALVQFSYKGILTARETFILLNYLNIVRDINEFNRLNSLSKYCLKCEVKRLQEELQKRGIS